MRALLSSDLGRLRLVSGLEGLSYLVLVGAAMPLKYLAGDPSWVRVVGAAHGALFVMFGAALGLAWLRGGLPFARAAAVFAWSLVPFGAIAIERSLRSRREAP